MGKKEDLDEIVGLYYGTELGMTSLESAWEAGFRAGQADANGEEERQLPAPGWGPEEER